MSSWNIYEEFFYQAVKCHTHLKRSSTYSPKRMEINPSLKKQGTLFRI